MKNAFYFLLLFVRFFSWLFGHVWQLDLWNKANFKLYVVTIHTLLNISRSKCNQAMKFDHLIEHNVKNIFLEKSYTKCGGETVPRSFPKKPKLRTSLN